MDTASHRKLPLPNLAHLSPALSASLDLEAVLKRATTALTLALRLTECCFSAYDPQTRTIYRLLEHTSHPTPVTSHPVPIYTLADYPAFTRVIDGDQVLMITANATEPEAVLLRERGQALLLGIALRVGEQCVGLAELFTDDAARQFTVSDIQLARALCEQAAAAMVNAHLFEESQRQTRELAALYDAATATSSVLETRALLLRLYEHIRQILTPDTFLAALHYPESATIEIALVIEHDQPIKPALPYGRAPLEQAGLTGWIIRNRQPLLIGDLQNDPTPVPPRHGARPARSWLGVPLNLRDQTIGVVSVQSFQPHAFDETDQRFIESLAGPVAAALEHARLYETVMLEKGRLEILHNLSQRLTTTLDPQEVAGRALDVIRVTLRAAKAILYSQEEASDRLRPVTVSGYAEEMTIEKINAMLDIRLGRGLVGHVALTRAINIVPDISQDNYWIHVSGIDEWVRSAVAIPLLVGDELVGVLCLGAEHPNTFNNSQFPILTAVGATVAFALQNARLYQAQIRRAHHLAQINELTRAATSDLSLQPLLQTLATHLQRLIEADACYITLWDERQRQPIPMAASGPQQDAYLQITPTLGEVTLTESTLETGHALAIEDALHSPYLSPHIAEKAGAASMLGLPFIVGEQKLGAALLAFHRPHRFMADELERGEQATRQIALAVAKALLFEKIRRQAEDLTAASEILRALNAAPDVLEIFPRLSAGLKAITHCERTSLLRIDERRENLIVLALDRPRPEFNLNTRVPITTTAIAQTVLMGDAHVTPDLATELDFPAERDLYEAGYRARVHLPLRVGGQVTGVLGLLWLKPLSYDQLNVSLLYQIADALALALEKNRLFTETLRRANEFETVAQVSAALRVAQTMEQMLPAFAEQAAAVVGATASTIFLVEPETGDLVLRGCYPPEASPRNLRRRLDQGTTGYVARSGQPYISQQRASDPLVYLPVPGEPHHLSGIQSSLTLPLHTQDRLIGVVHVGMGVPHPFSDSEIHLLTAIADIAGNALHRANVLETLEQRVTERTRELAQVNERLKELDRLKDKFVSNVSHELRTPITNISLYLGMLGKRGAESLERYLPTLNRETKRLARLIEDLLTLSRIDQSRIPMVFEPRDLDELLDQVLDAHLARAEAKHITLSHRRNLVTPLVPVDYAQIMQVFTNLISNAIAYTPPQGRVTVSSEFANSEPPRIKLLFHNSAPTIPAEDLPHLFERFYRGRTAYDSGEAGTGLGLAISKEIIERHAGQIEVLSREGEGTTFVVGLPI